MTEYFTTSFFTSTMGVLLYWCPLVLCTYGYAVRLARDIAEDKKNRDEGAWYTPKVTVGSIIGYGLTAILPAANLLAAIFSIAPEVFGRFFKFIGEVFDMPLVPDNEVAEKRREERCRPEFRSHPTP